MIVKTENELRQTAVAFDFKKPLMDPDELIKELKDAMFLHAGLGIAAPQLGYNVRVIALRGETKESSIVCFNPVITEFSETMNTMEEGCLSLPDVFARVVRPSEVVIEFQNVLQEDQKESADGLTARVYQHELDHLDGILMIDRIGPFAKKRAFEKAKKIIKMRARGKEKYKARFAL
tara:strand:+ start:54 stop:584 length:531 start_codon:yes stop_codon:yes gene_type:complete